MRTKRIVAAMAALIAQRQVPGIVLVMDGE